MPTARAALTGPGGRFEVGVEDVLGRPTEVYRDRLRSLRELTEVARRRGDDRTFLVAGDRRFGFATFVDRADAVGAALAADGALGPGDRLAVLAQNSPEWCLALVGAVNVGAVAVGLNGWWSADELVYGLRDSGARVLVADRKRFARIADRLDDCPDLARVYVIDDDDGAGHEAWLRDVGREGDGRMHRFAALLDGPSGDGPRTPIDEDDPAVILYTSGTTGRPKGAVSTHRNVVAHIQGTLFQGALRAAISGEERRRVPTVSLATTPLFHVSGCHSTLLSGLLSGVRLVMLEGRFTPEAVLRLIEREQVTFWGAVPTMVWRVCTDEARHRYDTASVQKVAYGGSPSADELRRLVRETFPNVARGGTNVYGLTETSSTVTALSPEEAVDRPRSVGLSLPGVRLRITAPDGSERPTGATGEIRISGPTVTPGYWGRPEATAEAIVDGWLRTGDLGHVDDEGYLFVTDREKDMIIRGGENVYCVEIEERLVAHPHVIDAAVVGVPHPALGQEVKAVVQVADRSAVTDDDVRAWVRETLAEFKVPAHVERRLDALPRNAAGKLVKAALQGEVSGP